MEEVRQDRKSRNYSVVRRPAPWWLVASITAFATMVMTIVTFGLLLGKDGLAVVQGWLLARWVFVEEDVDLQATASGSLDGMVFALGDRWSYYVRPEWYADFMESRSNRYVGVGITVDYTDERGVTILGVEAGSPAAEAGLVPGEIIIAVNGISAAGEARYEVMSHIEGREGEKVVFQVLGQEGGQREVTLTLAEILVKVASGYLMDSGVGVVTLHNFNRNAADEFQDITNGLIEEGASALVFDVRGNGGGYVGELTDILDYLLPEGIVFQDVPRWGFAYQKESDGACVDLPFAVLVDENSYSAAELFAAQLRESVGAYVVGEVTSGKGYSQITVPLINGGAMGISTAAYYTGSGESLIGVGIIPDREISLTEEEEALRANGKLSAMEDPQLQAALELLKE